MSVGADSNDSGAFLYGIFAAAIWQRRGNLMLLVGLCLIPCQSEAQSRSVPAPPPAAVSKAFGPPARSSIQTPMRDVAGFICLRPLYPPFRQ